MITKIHRSVYLTRLCVLLIFGLLVHAAPFSTLDSTRSSVVFVYEQMGVRSEGKFKQLSGTIQLDEAAPQNAHIEILIHTASVETGVPGGDDEIKSKAWLHSQKFPHARFVSQSIQKQNNGDFMAIGVLTMKGVQQTVSVPFTLKNRLAQGQFSFKRSTFRIGEGEWADTSIIADDVNIKFNLLLN